MRPLTIEIGEVFHRLTVESKMTDARGWTKYVCRCVCGNTVIVGASALKRGNNKSCGCLKHDGTNSNLYKHGGTKTRLFKCWISMRERCYYPKAMSYAYCGAKGIKVCNEWFDFPTFRDWALKNGYTDELTLDRINPYGNYEPSNCRWLTKTEQQNNKTTTVMLTIGGVSKSLTEWCAIYGKERSAVRYRIEHGDDPIVALTDPPRKTGPKPGYKKLTAAVGVPVRVAEKGMMMELKRPE